MEAEVKWKKKGGILVDPLIAKDWVIRVPTVRHRLKKSGSVALTPAERYDLKEKKGILFVDLSLKKYVYIPKVLMNQYPIEFKDCNGNKGALEVHNVKRIIDEHSLELIDILDESKYKPEHETGIAGDIRKKFGLGD